MSTEDKDISKKVVTNFSDARNFGTAKVQTSRFCSMTRDFVVTVHNRSIM